jgi:hypothetical protein
MILPFPVISAGRYAAPKTGCDHYIIEHGEAKGARIALGKSL